MIQKWRSGGEEKEKKGEVPEWIKELSIARGEDPKEFMETLKKDFFEHRVFVFTPKGDVIDLPTSSSPLDFAYAIHSEVGDHTVGAKVNGRMVALDSNLKNGDIVEIITKESARPSRKWL